MLPIELRRLGRKSPVRRPARSKRNAQDLNEAGRDLLVFYVLENFARRPQPRETLEEPSALPL
eukprot:6860845-Pyramimonas_sp.AAC.1